MRQTARIWLGVLGAVVDLVRRRPSAAQLADERRRALDLVADDMIRRDGRTAPGRHPLR